MIPQMRPDVGCVGWVFGTLHSARDLILGLRGGFEAKVL